MAVRSFQRSIRFTNNEWDAVVEAAERAGIAPGSFVRKAAARAAADDLYLYGGGLTPELAESDPADPPWCPPAHLPEAGGTRRIGEGSALRQSCRGRPRHPDQGTRHRPLRRRIVALAIPRGLIPIPAIPTRHAEGRSPHSAQCSGGCR